MVVMVAFRCVRVGGGLRALSVVAVVVGVHMRLRSCFPVRGGTAGVLALGLRIGSLVCEFRELLAA